MAWNRSVDKSRAASEKMRCCIRMEIYSALHNDNGEHLCAFAGSLSPRLQMRKNEMEKRCKNERVVRGIKISLASLSRKINLFSFVLLITFSTSFV